MILRKGFFLEPHIDYDINEELRYKVTLIYYFGVSNEISGAGSLNFNYNGGVENILPLSNRGVLFIPSPKTSHWIEEVMSKGEARFALSGWFI